MTGLIRLTKDDLIRRVLEKEKEGFYPEKVVRWGENGIRLIWACRDQLEMAYEFRKKFMKLPLDHTYVCVQCYKSGYTRTCTVQFDGFKFLTDPEIGHGDCCRKLSYDLIRRGNTLVVSQQQIEALDKPECTMVPNPFTEALDSLADLEYLKNISFSQTRPFDLLNVDVDVEESFLLDAKYTETANRVYTRIWSSTGFPSFQKKCSIGSISESVRKMAVGVVAQLSDTAPEPDPQLKKYPIPLPGKRGRPPVKVDNDLSFQATEADYGVDGAHFFAMLGQAPDVAKNTLTGVLSDLVAVVSNVEHCFDTDIREDKFLAELIRARFYKLFDRVKTSMAMGSHDEALLPLREALSLAVFCVSDFSDNLATRDCVEKLSIVLTPFFPSTAQLLWARLEKSGSIENEAWPTEDFDEDHNAMCAELQQVMMELHANIVSLRKKKRLPIAKRAPDLKNLMTFLRKHNELVPALKAFFQARAAVLNLDEVRVEKHWFARGRTGYVYRGTFKGTTVAFKVQSKIQLLGVLKTETRSLVEYSLMVHRKKSPFILGVENLCSVGSLFYMMELGVDSLHSFIQYGSIPFSTGMQWSFHAFRALEYLQREQFLHLDISTTNFVVSEIGNLKMCDFGCATKMEDLTPGQKQFGYFQSLLPQNALPDLKCEIFSYGVVITHLLLGDSEIGGRFNRKIIERVPAEALPLVFGTTDRYSERWDLDQVRMFFTDWHSGRIMESENLHVTTEESSDSASSDCDSSDSTSTAS